MEVFRIIRQYQDIEHLYESFPDRKIFVMDLPADTEINSPQTAEEAMKQKNIFLTEWGEDILYKTEFSQGTENYSLVQFTVGQLGFPNGGATTEEIYKKAEDLGLELCPAEVGPRLRLQYGGGDLKLIAMKQIVGRDGGPYVFGLSRYGDQLVLYGYGARPADGWGGGSRFVFRFRKLGA
jgi:hypothetical protein